MKVVAGKVVLWAAQKTMDGCDTRIPFPRATPRALTIIRKRLGRKEESVVAQKGIC